MTVSKRHADEQAELDRLEIEALHADEKYVRRFLLAVIAACLIALAVIGNMKP